jgi:hypothetical protein
MGEIQLLSTHLGEVGFDEDNPAEVLIFRFPLPPGFNKRHCELVIDLGENYPEFPPQDWYLNKGLRKNGRSLSGHYFENGFPGKKFCREGFAWYSFHIKEWKPNPKTMTHGDTLLTAVDAFYDAMKTE